MPTTLLCSEKNFGHRYRKFVFEKRFEARLTEALPNWNRTYEPSKNVLNNQFAHESAHV
jgi:hypothetical protein